MKRLSQAAALGLLAVFPIAVLAAGPVKLETDKSAKYGAYLTDADGRALYMFMADRQGRDGTQAQSNCYDACAKAWPPLIAGEGEPQAGPHVDKSLIGMVERKDGRQQATYNGWPLYYFVKDKGPGQATGQDVKGFGAEWYLLTAGGERVGHAAAGSGKRLPAPSQSKMSEEDRERFKALAEANLAEVETGKLAQQKASSQEVKAFAEHMIQDHGKILEEMKAIAGKKAVDMPGSPNQEHRAAMKKLEQMASSSESFDQAYMEQMVKDHQKALDLARDTAKQAKDAQLRQAAQNAAPVMEEHLETAQSLSRQMQAKGESRGKSAAGGSPSGATSK